MTNDTPTATEIERDRGPEAIGSERAHGGDTRSGADVDGLETTIATDGGRTGPPPGDCQPNHEENIAARDETRESYAVFRDLSVGDYVLFADTSDRKKPVRVSDWDDDRSVCHLEGPQGGDIPIERAPTGHVRRADWGTRVSNLRRVARSVETATAGAATDGGMDAGAPTGEDLLVEAVTLLEREDGVRTMKFGRHDGRVFFDTDEADAPFMTEDAEVVELDAPTPMPELQSAADFPERVREFFGIDDTDASGEETADAAEAAERGDGLENEGEGR